MSGLSGAGEDACPARVVRRLEVQTEGNGTPAGSGFRFDMIGRSAGRSGHRSALQRGRCSGGAFTRCAPVTSVISRPYWKCRGKPVPRKRSSRVRPSPQHGGRTCGSRASVLPLSPSQQGAALSKRPQLRNVKSSNPETAMRLTALILTVLISTTGLISANWPAWRGPAGDGVSPERNLPVKWSPSENIAWKLQLPQWSGATPIIWGDTIFLNVAEADGDQLSLWAVSRGKGEVMWKRTLSTGNNKQQKQNMSSPSPVTDGTRVWVMTGTGFLRAFDFKGTELWMRDIQNDYGRFGLMWGYANSPLLHQGALYVQVLHGMKTDDPSYVMKVDGTTGKTLWKVDRPTKAISESPDSYTTPALLRYGKTTEIVVTGGDVVTGHDPASGKELWRVDGLNPQNNPFNRIIASPLVVGEIVIAPTRERPMLAIKAGGRGDITATHRLWSFNNGPDVPTPVSDGSLVYSVTDRGVAYALELETGKVVYGPERLRSGTYSSSPVLADGKLYISNEDGLTSVVKAGPKFEVLAENPLEDYILSSPAVSDGQVFVRTAGYFWGIGNRRNSPTSS